MNRKSRFVKIPTRWRVSKSSTIGTPLIRYFAMRSSASCTLWEGVKKNGLMITPLSERFTLWTSSACSAIDMFLWITPNPPWRAIAIAIVESVTVSILALIKGILRRMFLANCTHKSTSFGKTWLSAGISKTSSNVYPSFWNFVSHFDIAQTSSDWIY